MHWEGFPTPFRHACKLYLFALLNIVDDAPRLDSARSLYPHIKTILGELVPLRRFTMWLVERGVDIVRPGQRRTPRRLSAPCHRDQRCQRRIQTLSATGHQASAPVPGCPARRIAGSPRARCGAVRVHEGSPTTSHPGASRTRPLAFIPMSWSRCSRRRWWSPTRSPPISFPQRATFSRCGTWPIRSRRTFVGLLLVRCRCSRPPRRNSNACLLHWAATTPHFQVSGRATRPVSI